MDYAILLLAGATSLLIDVISHQANAKVNFADSNLQKGLDMLLGVGLTTLIFGACGK